MLKYEDLGPRSSMVEQQPFKLMVGGSIPPEVTDLLRGRLMVGRWTLDPLIQVQILAPQPFDSLRSLRAVAY